MQLPRQQHVVLPVAAVGRMVVDVQVRLPPVPKREPRPHLHRISLRIIAIQVQIARRHPPAFFLRSVLIDSRVRAEPLVTVHIEDRNHK